MKTRPIPPPKGTIHRSSEGNLQFAVRIGEVVRYQPFSKLRLMKYWSRNEFTVVQRSMNSPNPLTKRYGQAPVFSRVSLSPAKDQILFVSAPIVHPRLHKSHNRRSGAPFFCAEYRGGRRRNQKHRAYAPDYLSGRAR